MDLALLGLVFLVVLVLLGGLSHGIMLLLPLPFLDLQHEHAFVFVSCGNVLCFIGASRQTVCCLGHCDVWNVG